MVSCGCGGGPGQGKGGRHRHTNLCLPCNTSAPQVERERDELRAQLEAAVLAVQQRVSLRAVVLEKKLEALGAELERRDSQLAVGWRGLGLACVLFALARCCHVGMQKREGTLAGRWECVPHSWQWWVGLCWSCSGHECIPVLGEATGVWVGGEGKQVACVKCSVECGCSRLVLGC